MKKAKTLAPNLVTARSLIGDKLLMWYGTEKPIRMRVSNALTDVVIRRRHATQETVVDFMFVGVGCITICLDGVHNISQAISAIDELVWATLIAEAREACLATASTS